MSDTTIRLGTDLPKLKILNLYAGIGGNRKNWGNDHEITAVEYNEEIASIYADLYPNDNLIIGDAHAYLLKHYNEFDFIWSSPPCPSHSRFRFMTTKMKNKKYSRPVMYPDMALYQEIILLKHYFAGQWIVENVKGYYTPLIAPQESGRHYFWCNFKIGKIKTENKSFIKDYYIGLKNLHGFDLDKYKLGSRKDQMLRNCVDPELGLFLLECAMNVKSKKNTKQTQLF